MYENLGDVGLNLLDIQLVRTFDQNNAYGRNLCYSYGQALVDTVNTLRELSKLYEEKKNDKNILRQLEENARMLEYIFSEHGPELTGSVRAASDKREA